MSRGHYSEDMFWRNEYNMIYMYLKVYICTDLEECISSYLNVSFLRCL
jgi:hypothetical protein